MMIKRAGVVMAGMALVISACSSSEPVASPSSSIAAEPATDLTVTASEFTYDTTNLAVPAGEEISIHFTNAGTIPHEWAVLKKGVRIATNEQFREDMVLFEVEAQTEGTTTTQTFVLETAGEYQFICALEGHFASGMHGTVTAVA